jgi:cob(I)alamin adenosyltransferase
MVRLTKIYTRTGDAGDTALVGGERVPKDDVRIEAYGTVDELNACIGLVRERNASSDLGEARSKVDTLLERVQQQLFNLGASLATRPESRWPGQPSVTAADIIWLETSMDEMNASLPKLKSFVLPGGGPVGSMCHLARTVARRAERRILTLQRAQGIEPEDLKYVNRLSDLLFVLGRWVAKQHGEAETLWEY